MIVTCCYTKQLNKFLKTLGGSVARLPPIPCCRPVTAPFRTGLSRTFPDSNFVDTSHRSRPLPVY